MEIKTERDYMSSVVFEKQNIMSLVNHHIALLKRFDITEDDEFSIIYFNLEDKGDKELSVVFQKILRRTDALFQDDKGIIVMLPGTDWNGATELLSGIQDFLNQAITDNIVTYPDDGKTSEELLGKLKILVKENANIELKV